MQAVIIALKVQASLVGSLECNLKLDIVGLQTFIVFFCRGRVMTVPQWETLIASVGGSS